MELIGELKHLLLGFAMIVMAVALDRKSVV